MANLYWQRSGSRPPGRASFSVEQQRATEVYLTQKANLPDAIIDILGDVQPDGDGGLERTAPVSHPAYPWLSAVAVSITPLGVTDDFDGTLTEVTLAEDELENPPIADNFMDYALYELTVEFAQLPYSLAPDDAVEAETIEWNDEAGVPQSTDAPAEWTRWTDWTYDAGLEVHFGQQGQMVFRRGDGGAVGSPKPHLFTFSGHPRVTIPKATVLFTWARVPYSYLTHRESTLVSKIGTINQLDWYGWDAGTLLYHGPKVLRRYTPPVPDRQAWDGGTYFAAEKLVDLQLVFEETFKTSPSVPPETDIENDNWIAAGHNLQPYLGGLALGGSSGCFYVTSPGTDPALQRPIYNSYPFQLLFRDPAVP